MANFAWAESQLASDSSVRRASISSVYLKMHHPSWSPIARVGMFYTSDDSLAVNNLYYWSLEDVAATDWELVP